MIFRSKKQRIGLALFSFFLSLGLLEPVKSLASNFNINPVKVSLSGKTSSQLLTLQNNSDELLRFQVKSYAWNQDAKGQMQLTPTNDIVVFPSLLSLQPKEERRLRIGTVTPVGETEKTYRVFVEELPSQQKPDQTQPQIRVLTKVGIPIFLQPRQPAINGDIEAMTVRNSQLAFQVKNTGNVHFVTQNVRVQGVDDTGKALFDRQQNGWYVLAGQSQPYNLPIPQQVCSKTKSLLVEVQTDNKKLQQRLAIPQGACGVSNKN
jgi:fimbrial chaperone protein